MSALKIRESGLSNDLRFQCCACRGFCIPQRHPGLGCLHFAVTWRLGETGRNACRRCRRTVADACVLRRQHVLVDNR
jgi:hypothetical protein